MNASLSYILCRVKISKNYNWMEFVLPNQPNIAESVALAVIECPMVRVKFVQLREIQMDFPCPSCIYSSLSDPNRLSVYNTHRCKIQVKAR
jgi:hypothetical protein